jgi:hypothetical protein
MDVFSEEGRSADMVERKIGQYFWHSWGLVALFVKLWRKESAVVLKECSHQAPGIRPEAVMCTMIYRPYLRPRWDEANGLDSACILAGVVVNLGVLYGFLEMDCRYRYIRDS